MDFSYQKNDNTSLFESFENIELLNMKCPQNYIPIYRRFFSLNETNFKNINLNHKLKLKKILKKSTENKYLVELENRNSNSNSTDGVCEKNVFFKLIPLLDPIKYMCSKYDLSDNNILKLPSFIENEQCVATVCAAKVRDTNNAAYVDSFFTYLTSTMLEESGFVHGIDFYGSYLGIKNDFLFNIGDDIDYLQDCKPFHENRGNLYVFDDNFQYDLMNRDTRDYKEPIKFLSTKEDNNILELSDICELDLSHFNGIFAPGMGKVTTDISAHVSGDISAALLYDSPHQEANKETATTTTTATTTATSANANTTKSSNASSETSRCSSRSSNTLGSETGSIQSESTLDGLSLSTASEDEAFVKIHSFPIQVVALERCEQTLDSFISSTDVTDEEFGSIVTQILMMLITYQKVFGLTHNDLHTNNIMYVKTDKQYLFYKHDGRHYKVPTFGKIYKIIDYGRAIYKFRGNLLCSDSYHSKGDAATQYNFEPYIDTNKRRVEPNFSFDLCRLGCALYDMLLDDETEMKSTIVEIMTSWCLDDKGRNILYKNNGEERYPDFKLYKMIARTVHNHVPAKVIQNEYFNKYHISKKKINKQKIMNIDSLISHQ